MGELLTAYQLAEVLNLSVETIWRYTRQGKIPVVKLGEKQYRYEKGPVLSALSSQGQLLEEEESVYHKQGQYTYRDYLKIPEEPGYRVEILDGILVKEPAPSVQHQRVSRELQFQLKLYFDHRDPAGEIFNSPLDVTLGEKTVLQPDLFFISGVRRGIMRPERIDGACDLVVEILSPASRRRDRVRKMEIYRQAGIPHYWLADPDVQLLEAFILSDGLYSLIYSGGPGDEFAHSGFPGLNLDLEKVFYRPS